MAQLSPVLHPPRRRPPRSFHPGGPQPAERPRHIRGPCAAGRRGPPARRSPAAHRLPPSPGSAPQSDSTGQRWMPDSKTSRCSSTPRNPYVPVDALRSTRPARIELDGVVLAESPSPVMVFETGLPTRYYLNPTESNFEHLTPSDTVTACPYKGTTSRYWSIRIEDIVHQDLAWAYDFQPASSSPSQAWSPSTTKGRPVPLRPAAPLAQDTPCRIGQRADHQVSATARQRRYAALRPVATDCLPRRSRRPPPVCGLCVIGGGSVLRAAGGVNISRVLYV